MTAWQSVKPGDTVTITRTFVVERAHVSEATGRAVVFDGDFRAHSEAEGFELSIVRDDPWHEVLDPFDNRRKCGCDMGQDHTLADYYIHYGLAQPRTHTVDRPVVFE